MAALYEYSYKRRRIAEAPPAIRTPNEAESAMKLLLGPELEQENLVVIALNSKNVPIGNERVYIGNIAGASVRVGEVFRHAVRQNAAAIIVGHNHPSGDPTPSAEDVRITGEMAAAGKVLDIELLDHIIVGESRCVSLRALGALLK